MKLLTKNSDYAIRTLMELGLEKDVFLSAKAISVRQDIPYSYLRKIAQVLIKKGFVESREGVSGGMRLKRKTREIKLLDIIHAFQGEIQLSECVFRNAICPNRACCVLRDNIVGIEQSVTKQFGSLTIASIIRQHKRRKNEKKNYKD